MTPTLIDQWRGIPTAIVADVSKCTCLIDPDIRPLRPAGQQPRLFGCAVTAICAPPDFGAVLHALDSIRAGDVLMIDARGHRAHAMIGGILGGFLQRRGAAGVVCDGAVRDVGELAGWDDFAVFARWITPRGPEAAQRGDVNGVARIGGLSVSPGDLIIGDDDGLVALTPESAADFLEPAQAKLALEDEWQAKLKRGISIADTFRLEPLVR
jgi:4-hydroxy-4-methyl-2-oxoglutarate aldolase